MSADFAAKQRVPAAHLHLKTKQPRIPSGLFENFLQMCGKTVLSILHYSRCRPDHFKLCPHLLDLLGLLLDTRSHGRNLPVLQSDHCRLSFSRGLQFLHEVLLLEQLGLQFLHEVLLFEQLVYRERRCRRETPRWPFASTTTGSPETGTPRCRR